jgi:hypothetical protein
VAGSPAYEARNARARALGYRSYYDYRAHGNGALPPSQPRLSGAALRRARGHAGAADLRRETKPGTLIMATPDASSRRKDGTYGRVFVTAIGEDGSEREYLLKGKQLDAGELDKLMADLNAAGAVMSPTYVLGPPPADEDEPADLELIYEDDLSDIPF